MDFKLWNADAAHLVTGLDDETGKPMELGPDIFLYWRLGAFEQGVFNRLAIQPEHTLEGEVNDLAHTIALGNPEELREYLHDAVDNMLTAIYVSREIISKADGHEIHQGRATLDDILDRMEEKSKDAQP